MKVAVLSMLGIVVVFSCAGSALGQHHHHHHHRGHLDYHPGQWNWHNGHLDYQRGHYDWHDDHGSHYVPSYSPAYVPSYSPSPTYVERNEVPTVVRRPSFDGGVIRIANPASAEGAIKYTINGYRYTMRPGETQTINADRSWTIRFDRGTGASVARYALRSGNYTFGISERGWELFRGTATVSDAPDAPSLGLPSNTLVGGQE